jgi:hypothetical protein
MAITSQSDYIAAKAARAVHSIHKVSIANQIAGGMCSMYRSTGPVPSQPAIPGAAVVCDRATAGALYMPVAAVQRYIDALALNCTTASTHHLCDRVLHLGGLLGNIATAQTCNTPALPVRAPAAECEFFLEWYADTGSTAVTATVNVTYTDATSGNVTVAMAATMRAGRILPIIPVTGKIIAVVNTVTLSLTTGTAGNFGVTAYKRLVSGLTVIVASLGDKREALILPIDNDACLALIIDCTTTSTGDIRGTYELMDA